MKKWRNHKKPGEALPSFLKAGVHFLNTCLVRAAAFLQRKTNHCSPRKKKGFLLFFVLVFATGSSVIILQSIRGKTKPPLAIDRVKTIATPGGNGRTDQAAKAALLSVQRFNNYMDSLGTSAEGRKRKDSLLQSHPQLMDSVHQFLHFFLEPSKTQAK